MNTSKELERSKEALKELFFQTPLVLSQLGYTPRQEEFVDRTVKLLYELEFGILGQSSASVKGLGILESIRITKCRIGVVEFSAFRDIVMEEAPQDRNILADVREQVIREKGLEDLVNIFGDYPNPPRTVVQVCVVLDPGGFNMQDPDWLMELSHPQSTYYHGGFIRTTEIDDPALQIAPRSTVYTSRLEGCELAVEMRDKLHGRTSERWRILRSNSQDPVAFIGRMANHKIN